MRALALALIVLVVGSAAAVPAAAQSRCTSLKYKAAGRAALAKAKCKRKAARAGVAVDADCVARAEAALSNKWSKAELKGDCVETGELGDVQAAVDAFVAAVMDSLEPPAPTAVCCEGGGSCWHGTQFADAASCVQFGTTAGAPGTVCDGATGSCVAPPASPGQCCHLPSVGVCNGGPALDLAGCVAAGGLDYPFSATCLPSGACSFGP